MDNLILLEGCSHHRHIVHPLRQVSGNEKIAELSAILDVDVAHQLLLLVEAKHLDVHQLLLGDVHKQAGGIQAPNSAIFRFDIYSKNIVR